MDGNTFAAILTQIWIGIGASFAFTCAIVVGLYKLLLEPKLEEHSALLDKIDRSVTVHDDYIQPLRAMTMQYYAKKVLEAGGNPVEWTEAQKAEHRKFLADPDNTPLELLSKIEANLRSKIAADANDWMLMAVHADVYARLRDRERRC